MPEIWDRDGLEPTLAVLREASSPRGREYVDRHAGKINWTKKHVFGRFDEDYTFLISQHGHLPEQDLQAVFAMTGPDIAQGVRFTGCTVSDEAVTFAHLLGLELPDADGAVVSEMLRMPAQLA